MSDSDVDIRDGCPICGGVLTPRKHALYCGNCDLVYEDDGDNRTD